jgi:phosphate transport system permease protein
LSALLWTIANQTVGLVAVVQPVELADLSDRRLEEMSEPELSAILQEHLPRALRRRLDRERPLRERSADELRALIREHLRHPQVVEGWSLADSLLHRSQIEADVQERLPGARLRFHAWLNIDLLRRPMSSRPAESGVRTAILGSLWLVGITIVLSFPIGVGAAVYLEEYATDSRLKRLVQTNINNLAGVPSIIYGMVGLAVFVRTLEPLTSGAAFGISGSNGRTILSAAMTMALLVLPLVIINSQEAIRSVPRTFREAAYGLGATRWQTTWHHVLPAALPGILTGTILSTARAMGETAPLIVVGASSFIVADPQGPFSKFTALPIQIYSWSSRPQDEFRHIAAAAIVVLLVMMLILNSGAIVLRNRFSRRL